MLSSDISNSQTHPLLDPFSLGFPIAFPSHLRPKKTAAWHLQGVELPCALLLREPQGGELGGCGSTVLEWIKCCGCLQGDTIGVYVYIYTPIMYIFFICIYTYMQPRGMCMLNIKWYICTVCVYIILYICNSIYVLDWSRWYVTNIYWSTPIIKGVCYTNIWVWGPLTKNTWGKYQGNVQQLINNMGTRRNTYERGHNMNQPQEVTLMDIRYIFTPTNTNKKSFPVVSKKT